MKKIYSKIVSLFIIFAFLFENISYADIVLNDKLAPNTKAFYDELSNNPEEIESIWFRLYRDPLSHVGEYKNIIPGWGKTLEQHVKLVCDLESALYAWKKRRGNTQEGLAILNERRASDLGAVLLQEGDIAKFLELYNSLTNQELKILRYAMVLHDVAKVKEGRESTKIVLEYATPIVNKLKNEGFFTEEEAKVVLALICLHNTLHTLHFGETLANEITQYLKENGVNQELYFRLAPILYIADVGSAGIGKGSLRDVIFRNAEFINNPKNFASLTEGWARTRLVYGFCGYEKTPMIFYDILQEPPLPDSIKKTMGTIRETDEAGYEYFLEDFLFNATFTGHAVYIFRNMNSQSNGDNNGMIKLLYLLAKLNEKLRSSGDKTFSTISFEITGDNPSYARYLNRLMETVSISEIKAFVDDNGSFSFKSFCEKFHLIADIKDRGQTLFIYAKQMLSASQRAQEANINPVNAAI